MSQTHAAAGTPGSPVHRTKTGLAELREALFESGYPRENENALDAVLGRVMSRRFRRGEIVIREGNASVEAYVVRRGKLCVEAGHGSRARALAILRPGSIVGEIGLLRAAPRTATVTAVEDSELFVLDRKTFARLVGSSVEFRRRLEGLAAARQSRAAAQRQ